MLKRALSHRPTTSRIRTRLAVVAAGLGASVGLGVGVASAADGAPAHPAPTAQTQAAVAHGSLQAVAGPGNADVVKDDQRGSHQAGHDAGDKSAHKAGESKAGKKKSTHGKSAGKEAGEAKTGGWTKPVRKYHLSASFNQAGGMWSHKHSGQDFAVPTGTPVRAAHSGVVVKAGPNGGGDGPAYGNAIVISNGHGTYTQYAHLSKIGVHIGDHVKAGEQIGRSGNTGNSSGPHLHFEVRTTPHYGSAVDPVRFLDRHGLHL